MSYTNLPAYQPAPGVRILKAHRFAIAQRLPGLGAVVTQAYKTKREAELARARSIRGNEWASFVLARREDGWVPATERRARVYALPSLVAAS
jgi:hypothetical protein